MTENCLCDQVHVFGHGLWEGRRKHVSLLCSLFTWWCEQHVRLDASDLPSVLLLYSLDRLGTISQMSRHGASPAVEEENPFYYTGHQYIAFQDKFSERLFDSSEFKANLTAYKRCIDNKKHKINSATAVSSVSVLDGHDSEGEVVTCFRERQQQMSVSLVRHAAHLPSGSAAATKLKYLISALC